MAILISRFVPNQKTSEIQPTAKQIQQLVALVAEKSTAICRIFCKQAGQLFLLSLCLAAAPRTASAAGAAADIIEYHLGIELHPAEHRLVAAAVLALPPAGEPIRLRLVPQAVIESVQFNGTTASHDFDNGTLTITPDATAAKAPVQLTIRYRADFTDSPPTETIGVEDPSFGISATILTEGTYLSAATPWFPQVAGMRGRHRVEVTAPAGIAAVTAGRLLKLETGNDRTMTVWENHFPMEGLALTAGAFTVDRDDFDSIQLLTFLSADNAALAPGYLAAMRRHLAFYRELLGPYPYPKFAVVENFLPTGYGMPSWTLLGKSVVRLPFLLDTSLPHEIVHSWWGNAVEVDYARGNWSEGLTTYLADYLLKERSNPGEALEYRRKLLRDYAALVTPHNDFPLTAFSGRMAKYQQAVGYGKAAMVFHMLRREVGDQGFWSALRRMAGEGNGRELGWDDIERIFSVEAGTDLRWFFAQWVEQKGAPELVFDEVRSVRSAKGWTVSGLIRQAGGSYRLDLPLQLTGATGEELMQTVPLTGKRTPFRFELTAAPARLSADPQTDLFRRLSAVEVPATINDLLTPRRPLVVIADGQRELFEASRELLKGLHWTEAEIVNESTLNPATLAGRDLLLIGWPRRAELRPTLPSGLTITANGGTASWTVENQPSGSDTLFALLAGREHGDGVRALFLANTPGKALPVAPKISHYGRYSLLLFDAGRNVVKTTWESQASPLKFVFAKEPRP